MYDVVLIDTPSGFGGITMGAMRAVDAVISPLQAEPIALRSVTQLLEVIGALRLEGARTELAGLVLTMLQLRNEQSLSVAQELWTRFPDTIVFNTTIPRDVEFLAASAAGVPLTLLSRKPPAVAAAFTQLAQELESRIELRTKEGHDGPIALFA